MSARPPAAGAFTLVEMLVGMVVAIIFIGLMIGLTTQVGSVVRNANNKMDAFQSAQAGFDLMTQKLADATLNTYYDYDVPYGSTTAPSKYIRRSDLHFLVSQNAALAATFPEVNSNSGQSIFCQVPAAYSNTAAYANIQGTLNACGYFVQFGSDKSFWPSAKNGQGTEHYRYQLMQSIQPTELNGIYGDFEGDHPEDVGTCQWIKTLPAGALPIANNVIALIVWPRLSLSESATVISPNYEYNSRQGVPTPANAAQSEQLPPILQISLVAIDANSAARLERGATKPGDIESALAGKFARTDHYQQDMQDLQAALVAKHIQYRVLTASITLRESKWSSVQ
ncbi:MAG: hypothetical protein INR62_04125 [Rhodospirillales bacterium]|nr:hypothetical protein [Acetobacter sp.]